MKSLGGNFNVEISPWMSRFNNIILTYACACSAVSNSEAPRAVAHYAPLSMETSRQECKSGLPFSSHRIFLSQGSNLHTLCLSHCQAGRLPLCCLASLQSTVGPAAPGGRSFLGRGKWTKKCTRRENNIWKRRK